MDLDAATGRDKAKDRITIDRMAARCELIVDALKVLIDGEHVVVAAREFLIGALIGEVLC